MDSAAQESGGIGGKLRKPALRRRASTPYDRPPTAARDRGLRTLSSLVDPASRMIAKGASRLFSSVFRKRLTVSTVEPGGDPQPNQETLVSVTVDSLAAQEQRDDNERTMRNSDSDGISELEQLFQQKTFNRLEFEHLTELLRARTVGSDTKENVVDDTLQKTLFTLEKEKVATPTSEITTPRRTIRVPEETMPSPVEIAKAYMESKQTKLPASNLAHNRAFNDEGNVAGYLQHKTKVPETPVPSRSLIRFTGPSENPDYGYFTPQPRGRSAIYKMSQSPYFKPQSSLKGVFSARDGSSGLSTSSQGPSASSLLTTSATTPYGGKQVKRGRSLLDNDLGYYGPIRHTRQKIGPMSPLKGKPVPGSLTPVQKPLHVPDHRIQTPDDDPDFHIPVQSSEMARKILQQLDKLVPSPKEKTSEVKPIIRDEPPPKLTVEMLHGRALRSMEDIKSSHFVGDGLVVDAGESSVQNLPRKHDRVQDNGPSKLSSFKGKTPIFDGFVDAAMPSGDELSDDGKALAEIASKPVKLPHQPKPAFSICAPEDTSEQEDDDDHKSKTALPPFGNNKVEQKFPELEAYDYTSKHLVASLGSMPATSAMSVKESKKKVGESTMTSFNVLSATNPIELGPTKATQPIDESGKQQRETSPTPTFGLQGSNPFSFVENASNTASQNNSAKLASEPGYPSSTVAFARPEKSDLEKEAKPEKPAVESLKGFSHSFLSDSVNPLTPVLQFGASITASSSNGFMSSKQSPFPFSADTGSISSDSIIFSTPTSSSFSTSMSSSSSLLSTFPAFPIGASSVTGSSSTLPVKESIFNFANTNTLGSSTNVASSSPSSLASSSSSSTMGSNSSPLPASNIFSIKVSNSSDPTAISSFSRSTERLAVMGSTPLVSDVGSGVFGSSSPLPPSSVSFSFTGFQGSTASNGSSSSMTVSSSGTTNLFSPFSSVTSFALAGSTASGFGNSTFGSLASKPTESGSGFSFSAGTTGSTTQTMSLPSSFSSAPSSSTFVFGKSATLTSGSPFSFGTPPSTFSAFGSPQPAFGVSGSHSNDEMNVEDSMAYDTVQPVSAAAAPSFSTFGQSASPATQGFVFGSSAVSSDRTSVFQFSGQQITPAPQNPNPFQPSGTIEFPSGGSFSLGSGGGDKQGRRIVKVRRDKLRKK